MPDIGLDWDIRPTMAKMRYNNCGSILLGLGPRPSLAGEAFAASCDAVKSPSSDTWLPGLNDELVCTCDIPRPPNLSSSTKRGHKHTQTPSRSKWIESRDVPMNLHETSAPRGAVFRGPCIVETEPDNNTSPTPYYWSRSYTHSSLHTLVPALIRSTCHMTRPFFYPQDQGFERGPRLGGVAVFSRQKFRPPGQSPKGAIP